ncbi:hypothetical protein [Fusibacter bizertensis]
MLQSTRLLSAYDISPKEGKDSLINYWNGDKEALINFDEAQLNSYIDFCVKNIDLYFSAIRKNLIDDWNDSSSKLLSVISINGFIIALNRQLKKNGINSFEFYNKKFEGWHYNFKQEEFPFTASQYRKFSSIILKEVFQISE